MGSLVDVKETVDTFPSNGVESSQTGGEKPEVEIYNDIILDDGTAQLSILAPVHMLSQLSWEMGCTLDVVANIIVHHKQAGGLEKLPPSPLLVADCIAVVADPHAFTLRTFELCHEESVPSNSDDEWWGYPTLPEPDENEIVFDMIFSANDERGCSLEDLQCVLNGRIEARKLSKLITELQESGQIYQDQQGRYLPL